jgi:hypothetical protein
MHDVAEDNSNMHDAWLTAIKFWLGTRMNCDDGSVSQGTPAPATAVSHQLR